MESRSEVVITSNNDVCRTVYGTRYNYITRTKVSQFYAPCDWNDNALDSFSAWIDTHTTEDLLFFTNAYYAQARSVADDRLLEIVNLLRSCGGSD